MKPHQITNEVVLELNPLYQESFELAQKLTTLLEGTALTQAQIDQIFKHAEDTMHSTGKNRTLAGRAGELLGKVGQKIQAGAQWLQDTTPMRFLDKSFNDAKATITQKLGQTEQGAELLKKLDYYAKLHAKYPATSKFFYNTLAVLTGAVSGGLTGPAALAATKTIDGV